MGRPLKGRLALHVVLNAIEEVVHAAFRAKPEAPALLLQVAQVGLRADHRVEHAEPGKSVLRTAAHSTRPSLKQRVANHNGADM